LVAGNDQLARKVQDVKDLENFMENDFRIPKGLRSSQEVGSPIKNGFLSVLAC
jgi:hypothetical protein